ncbi:MAG: DEAD/DEAH box helicase, partial [Deltaproteobacteria bacterium]|nr:DEAD/DEAH box helicase [Deltaproteobacteria bacterium]
MLPSILARQIKEGLIEYIEAVYPLATPIFAKSFPRTLRERDFFFHEHYVSVKLPFRLADKGSLEIFTSFKPTIHPYQHQIKAFERLLGPKASSTLLATGTGSGKTESFLYPILEYCHQRRLEPGLKALIIYPVNALASDQAQRLAKLIYSNHQLKGNLSVGLYIGGSHTGSSMTENKVITDHKTIINNPPSILLTNYKMLDYLLIQPRAAALWKNNQAQTLKYIVADELHCYDGAQGTDLACLIRRLKSRLNIKKNHLCCVGTSAALAGHDQGQALTQYASAIFGEAFDSDSVITEGRFSAPEFLASSRAKDFTVPNQEAVKALSEALRAGQPERFLQAAAAAWFEKDFSHLDIMAMETRLELGRRLIEHNLTRRLLSYLGGQYRQTDQAAQDLCFGFPALAKTEDPALALEAIYALISHARSGTITEPKPFLKVEVHFWFKELSHFLAKVTDQPVTYSLANDLKALSKDRFLPLITCLECFATGWGSVINEKGSLSVKNLSEFYDSFHKISDKVRIAYPYHHEDLPKGFIKAFLCPKCLQLDPGDDPEHLCSSCGSKSMEIIVPKKLDHTEKKNGQRFICPHCRSQSGLLLIVGLQSATVISSVISLLFASRFNDHKKTLAFSDSVQDAAHRAGFFNSRTWLNSLKGSIQRYVIEGGQGQNLDDFTTGLVKYWSKNCSQEEFVTKFIAPNMVWKQSYQDMKRKGFLSQEHDGAQLLTKIENRLGYEIMLEFGRLNFRGRTLVNCGSSTLFHDPESISQAALRLRDRLSHLAALPQEAKTYQRILIGLLRLMRNSGAFDDKVFLEHVDKQSNYHLSADYLDWLPKNRPINTPKFVWQPMVSQQNSLILAGQLPADSRRWPLARPKNPRFFDLALGNGRYRDWIARCLGPSFDDSNLLAQITALAFLELASAQVIVSLSRPKNGYVWALSKKAIFVTAKTTKLTCPACHRQLWVGSENLEFWLEAPCPYGCKSQLVVSSDPSSTYFKKIFESGDHFRVMANEHTNNLAQEEREKLEKAFKGRPGGGRPWDPNLLSCTPSLELGFDLGDLCSIILCGVPPNQSRYAQRAGRAGGRDGNSLIITAAMANPHDLYFYADPLEIMAAPIEPPKIFLKATAVLERQFVAFCLDNWVKAGANQEDLPENLGHCLDHLNERPANIKPSNNRPANKFPDNFLNFIKTHIDKLLSTFLAMFPELSHDDDHLYKEIELLTKGSVKEIIPIIHKIQTVFDCCYGQRQSLKQKIAELDKKIDELMVNQKGQIDSYELDDLRSEKNALRRLLININSKDVLNFLMDEGLLPNYAFPESGVILNGIITKKEPSSDPSKTGSNFFPTKNQKPDKQIYQFNRPSSLALSELAPGNTFYAAGHKFMVDQLDPYSDLISAWRLCPNCSHAQLEEIGRNSSACPSCGSPMWADTGQKRFLIKVNTVYSNMNFTQSLIGDDNDIRNRSRYLIKTLVDIDENIDILKSFTIKNDKFTFAYEFISKVMVRDINFGHLFSSGDYLKVQGQNLSCNGFVVCKHCGRVQDNPIKPKHSIICPARLKINDQNSFLTESLYLYREISTEALRILVPATTMERSNVILESFMAAFKLGLKGFFGKVEQLRFVLNSLPVRGTNYRKQYLVVYDSLPGGTGYLKQLIRDKQALISILEKALQLMENCSCWEDPSKDGCYRCLLAHRQNQGHGQISRKKAIELLSQILSGRNNLEETSVSLSNFEVQDLLESELERRFIEAFPSLSTGPRPITLAREMIRNKLGFRLEIGHGQEKVVWIIEPQVKLGPADGLGLTTVPDFVFWPTKSPGKIKPVAVYTDGFTYHKDKVTDDTLKRAALTGSGKFVVWTLTWSDIESLYSAQANPNNLIFKPNSRPSGAKVYRPMVNQNPEAWAIWPENCSAMELLVYYLQKEKSYEVFQIHSLAYAYSQLDPEKLNDPGAFQAWHEAIPKIEFGPDMEPPEFGFKDSLFGSWRPHPQSNIEILAGFPKNGPLKVNKRLGPFVWAILEDRQDFRGQGYEDDWKEFWHFSNVMSFSKRFMALTRSGLENRLYGSPLSPPSSLPSAWAESLDLIFDPLVKDFAKKCSEMNLPVPDHLGLEICGPQGQIIGEAELTWSTQKIALLLPSKITKECLLTLKGWKIISVDD